jgi:hypothetical protein
MDEAKLRDPGSGLAPTSAGWFTVNVRDAMWLTSEGGEKRPTGSECPFEERTLRAWDFFHSPAGTEHIFVGAGEEPCVILMVGARPADQQIRYVVSELAARYGASAERELTNPDEAYAGFEPSRLARPDYWNRLPWS